MKRTASRLFAVRLVLSLLAFLGSFAAVAAQVGRVDYSLNLDLQPAPGYSRVQVEAIAVQPDGKPLIGGKFQTRAPNSRAHLIRVNADNTIDTSFSVVLIHPYISPFINIVEVQSDGKILIAGIFSSVNGVAKDGVARLNADGSVDNSFTFAPSIVSITSGIRHLRIQRDGKIAVGGWWQGGYETTYRLNSDGSQDTTFGPPVHHSIEYGQNMEADSNNRMLLCSGTYNGTYNGPSDYFRRMNPDGTRDASFAVSVTTVYPPYSGYDCGVKELNNGRLLVWGKFSAVNGVPRNGIAMLNPDGSLVPSFNPEISSSALVSNADLQPDGKIVFVNYIIYPGSPNSTVKVDVGRLNADGTSDRSWRRGRGVFYDAYDTNTANVIATIKLRGNKLLVGGKFFRFDGAPRTGVVQLKL